MIFDCLQVWELFLTFDQIVACSLCGAVLVEFNFREGIWKLFELMDVYLSCDVIELIWLHPILPVYTGAKLQPPPLADVEHQGMAE